MNVHETNDQFFFFFSFWFGSLVFHNAQFHYFVYEQIINHRFYLSVTMYGRK